MKWIDFLLEFFQQAQDELKLIVLLVTIVHVSALELIS